MLSTFLQAFSSTGITVSLFADQKVAFFKNLSSIVTTSALFSASSLSLENTTTVNN